MAPGRRVTEYVTLLTWFKTFTPEDHADRDDLTSVIKTLTGLDKLFKEVKDRAERERQIAQLQTRIIKCPVILVLNLKRRHLYVFYCESYTRCCVTIHLHFRCYWRETGFS